MTRSSWRKMFALHVTDIACLFSFRCLFLILIMLILFSQLYIQLLPQQKYARVEQWCSYFFCYNELWSNFSVRNISNGIGYKLPIILVDLGKWRDQIISREIK